MGNAETDSTLLGTGVFTGFAGPIRIESKSPAEYRLARKPDGTLILQGAYMWHDGYNSGHEWREIPIVDIEGLATQ